MKHKYFFVCGLIILHSCLSLSALTAVTYTFSGGRLGDNLISYCHAKWISYVYNIPLLYKPFEYSEQLMLHELEIHYTQELERQFEKIVTYNDVDGIIDPCSGYLYVIPFFCESIFNRYDADCPFLFFVDWSNQEFKALLQKMICPTRAYEYNIPSDGISVALHVRKGTNWDIPNYRITPAQLTASHPLRWPPDVFYTAQIKKIIKWFPNNKIYIQLFTDHDRPEELINTYKKNIACDRITYSYRTTENNEFINVLEDFFALTKFNCLIRPDSNYSIVASKLGNYKILISPWHGIVQGLKTTIDEINIEVNGKSSIVKENVDIF